MNKIYNENCLDTMRSMQDNTIDLTLTSPPYGDIRSYKGYTFDFELIARELFRVTKYGGVVVWVVGDETVKGSESGTSFKQALYFMQCGFKLHDTMIYVKENPVPVGGLNRYYQKFEYMFVFSKGSPITFNPIHKPRENKHNDKRTCRVKGFNRNSEGEFNKKETAINENVKLGNVWQYVVGGGNSSSDPIAFKHPAIFPEKLAQDHILTWSNELDWVYDPFMGSGTVAVSSIKNNRSYIGSEVSKEYCEIAEQRISNLGTLI